MTEPNTDRAAALVDAHGRPARRKESKACPQCGAGTDQRVKSSGFGVAHPVCVRCGHAWPDEVWRD